MNEEEGIDGEGYVDEPSPAERLAAYLKGVLHSSFRSTNDSGNEGRRIFARELLVTLGLLFVWHLFTTYLPLPLIRWDAAHQFGDTTLGLNQQITIGALGLGTYFLAHWIVFWIVMAVPRLRKMGFDYDGYLNRRILWLTMLLSPLNAWLLVRNFKNWVSPMGERILSPYFLGHQHAMYFAAIITITAGVAFTLIVLQFIRRYGIPFPVTCMVLWLSTIHIASVFHPIQAFQNFLRYKSTAASRGPLMLGFLATVLVAGMIVYIAIKVLKSRYWKASSSSSLKRLTRIFFTEEPPSYIFSVLSFAFFAVLFGAAIDNLMALRVFDKGFSAWYIQHPTLKSAVMALSILPSAFIIYRLYYNPSLRFRLGEALSLDETLPSIKRKTYKALALWCGFAFLVTSIGFLLRLNGWNSQITWLAWFLWDFFLFALTAVLFRTHYACRGEGFRHAVYSHGYNEPIYAVKKYLEREGIASRIMGEPFALFNGYLVGPVAMKHLLVRESDMARAEELINRLPSAQ